VSAASVLTAMATRPQPQPDRGVLIGTAVYLAILVLCAVGGLGWLTRGALCRGG
jgi:hypothetical protein